jgi:hypothetical protein
MALLLPPEEDGPKLDIARPPGGGVVGGAGAAACCTVDFPRAAGQK